MIREPISGFLRFVLGCSSILILLLLYTLLSSSRQVAARNSLRDVAVKRLSELEDENAKNASQVKEANQLGGDEGKAKLEELQAAREKIEAEVAKFTEIRDNPQKEDSTVPSWSMLIQDGLIRSASPQGAFKKKEVWLLKDFKATGIRLCTALVVGIFLSIFVGLAMGCFDPVDAFLMPPFAFFSKVPATAVLPIFFVLIQINFKMYVAIIVFGMLPSLAQAISASVRKDVPEELIYKAYTLGASEFEVVWNVIFKQVLPRIIDAFRLQIGPALILLVAAEWMVSGEGVGYRLRLFYQRTDMTVVFVYVLLLGLIGLAADYGLIWLRRKLCPWFGD